MGLRRAMIDNNLKIFNDLKNLKNKKILIVSGGTGGHIFPAVVFGSSLKDKYNAEVSYISGARPLELEIYKALNIAPYKLSLSGSPLGSRSFFARSPLKILKRLFEMLKAFFESLKYINKIRPERVFLFGGYISFMPLLICKIKKIKVIIHEQNAVAGRVTRIAARLKIPVASGWEICEGLNKKNFVYVGIPVREPKRFSRPEAVKRLKIPDNIANKLLSLKIIGVAGGSLGGRGLAQKILDAANELDEFYFLMLGDEPEFIKNKNNNKPKNIYFTGRQWDINPFYSLCDILICRAGGSTLAEILKWGIPAVSVPWSGAAENHQYKNAECFAKMGGGLVWHEDDKITLVDAIKKLKIY